MASVRDLWPLPATARFAFPRLRDYNLSRPTALPMGYFWRTWRNIHDVMPAVKLVNSLGTHAVGR